MKNAIIIGKKAVIFMFVCITASFSSCQTKIVKIEQVKKNPVEYIFSSSKDSLHSVIIKKLRINNMMLWDASHGIMVLEEVSNMFSKKENSSDFCLMPIYYICKSKNYLSKNGDTLDYEAWFYLHLELVDKYHTKVKIKTIDPKVIVGRELLPLPPHFVRKDKTIPVEPSTIEEYEILLTIGKLVGENGMPPVILPEKK